MKIKIIVATLVSLICLSNKTNAQNYYVDVNPDSCVCVTSTPTTSDTLASYWDLDHDGTDDFIIFVASSQSDCKHGIEVARLIPLGKNKIAGDVQGVFMLNAGDTINKQPSWANASYLVYFYEFTGYTGYWKDLFPDSFKYAGIKFYSGTNLYYGWLRLNVIAQCQLAKVLVTEYAYSTFPDFYISSVNEINKSSSLLIYPNPANDNLTIAFVQKATIEILNIQGQTILQQKLQQGKTNIDISGLSKGIYFARIQDGKQVLTEKIIIQ